MDSELIWLPNQLPILFFARHLQTWSSQPGHRLGVLSHWWIAFAASSFFVVSGHLLIKAGLNELAPLPSGTGTAARVLHSVLQLKVLAGLSIYLIGTVCWMRAVSQKEISFLYPLSSVNFVLIAAASMVFLQETIRASESPGYF